MQDTTLFKEYFRNYTEKFNRLLNSIDGREVVQVIAVLLNARETGRAVYLIGNGGCSACASHFAIDLLNVNRKSSAKPFRALSLTDNSPVLTALSNDHGYEEVFRKQLERYFCPGDVVIALSASGNSQNILHAVNYANDHDGVTIGLVGFDGGRLKKACRYSVHVNTPKGDYGIVEDAFMFLDHLITGYISKMEQR